MCWGLFDKIKWKICRCCSRLPHPFTQHNAHLSIPLYYTIYLYSERRRMYKSILWFDSNEILTVGSGRRTNGKVKITLSDKWKSSVMPSHTAYYIPIATTPSFLVFLCLLLLLLLLRFQRRLFFPFILTTHSFCLFIYMPYSNIHHTNRHIFYLLSAPLLPPYRAVSCRSCSICSIVWQWRA